MTNQHTSTVLHKVLWCAQILLALAFGMSGFMKISQPMAALAANGMGFVNHTPENLVRFIGVCELLGDIGLILPSLMRIKPILSPLAAVGLATIMVLAIKEHLSQNEPIIPNLVLLSLALFISWGRYKKAPISAK